MVEGVGEQEQTRDRADWVRMKLVPQFESQVRGPIGRSVASTLVPRRSGCTNGLDRSPGLHPRA